MTVETARIDTHNHVLPPQYVAWLSTHGIDDAGGRSLPDWSAGQALAFMDEAGIGTAILSVSTPGVHLGDDVEARAQARSVNEFCAALMQERPDRFGFFAVLPLPDVDGALIEATHALDTLHADGVVLLANVRGQYLGDAAFDPLFDELNRRAAVVFIHPSELPGPAVPGIPPFAADFLLDTTRAAINLVTSGTVARCPDLKLVLSHAGGYVPYIAHRLAIAGPLYAGPRRRTRDILADLQRFYFDIALSSGPFALPSLLAFADPTHILYGSDWPFATPQAVTYFNELFTSYPLDEAVRHAITCGNARVLFPRLARPAMP